MSDLCSDIKPELVPSSKRNDKQDFFAFSKIAPFRYH